MTNDQLRQMASSAVPHRCLVWPFSKMWAGYGEFRRDGRKVRAHRGMWEAVNSRPIPAGLHVLHSCDNPPCVNPYHLRVGTEADNTRDAMERGRKYRFGDSRGTKNPRARLTEDQVRAIRANPEGLSHRLLAERYGVARATIGLVMSGKTWGGVA